MPDPVSKPRRNWSGGRTLVSPLSRSLSDIDPGAGKTFSLSFDESRREGLYNSYVRAGFAEDALRDSGWTGSPTGIEDMDRGLKLRGSLERSNALPDEIGYIDVDSAQKVAQEYGFQNISSAGIKLTRSTISEMGLRLRLNEAKRSMQIGQRIDAGSKGIWRKGVAFTGGLTGSMVDPGDVVTSLIPVGQSYKALKAGSRIYRTARQAERGAGILSSGIKAMRQGFAEAGEQMAREAATGSLGRRTWTRFKQGAVDGFGGAMLVEPFVSSFNRAAGGDYSGVDSLMNLTFGGILGGGMHAGFGAMGDAVARVDAYRSDLRYEAAINASPIGELARNLSRLPEDQRVELMSLALIDMAHGRALDMSGYMELFNLDASGRPKFGPRGDSIAFRSQVYRNTGGFIDAASGDKPVEQVASEFGVPEEIVSLLRSAKDKKAASKELFRHLARTQSEELERAAGILKARGEDVPESLGDFLKRTDPDGDIQLRLQKAKDAGYLDPTAKKEDLRRVTKAEGERGIKFYKDQDLERMEQAITDLDTAVRASREAQSRGVMDDPRKLHEWLESRVSPLNTREARPELVAKVDEARSRWESGDSDDLTQLQQDIDDVREYLGDTADTSDIDVEVERITAEYKDRKQAYRSSVGCLLGGAVK